MKQSDEEETTFKAAIAAIGLAREAIINKIGTKRGIQGTLDCPVCGTGTLRFTRASLNGHIHAACSTSGCVRWME